MQSLDRPGAGFSESGVPDWVFLAALPGPLPPATRIEPAGDLGTDQDWERVKSEALRLLHADRLDSPEAHLAYIRERIKPVLDHGMGS
jgi:hypothetical protein